MSLSSAIYSIYFSCFWVTSRHPNSSSATKRGDRIAVLGPPLSPYPVLIQRRFELKKGIPETFFGHFWHSPHMVSPVRSWSSRTFMQSDRWHIENEGAFALWIIFDSKKRRLSSGRLERLETVLKVKRRRVVPCDSSFWKTPLVRHVLTLLWAQTDIPKTLSDIFDIVSSIGRRNTVSLFFHNNIEE